MKLLFFDTETTGLPKNRNTSIYDVKQWPYIVQLSWLLYDTETNVIINNKDYIIKCVVDIPEESSNIHHITNEISKEQGILIQDALYFFNKDFEKCDKVIAHNLSFDKNMFRVECIRYNCNTFFGKKLEYCTMKETTDFCGIVKQNSQGSYMKYPNLGELHKKLFGYIPKGLHNSMSDVMVCLRCYFKYIYNFDITNTDENIKHLYLYYCG